MFNCDPSGETKPVLAFTLQEKMKQYSDYDFDKDGTNEIDTLKYLSFENPEFFVPPNSSLVLIMVEPRLLDTLPSGNHTTNDLLDRIQRYKDDLGNQGYQAMAIEAQVYGSLNSQTEHQDGLTVLAMRQFFKSVWAQYSNFTGVVFIGSFPEAMIVRRMIWRKDTVADGGDFMIDSTTVAAGTSYLSIVPEIIAHRADLVLADLNGNWDKIYFKGPKNLEAIKAVPVDGTANNWPQSDVPFKSNIHENISTVFEDFFFIEDDDIIKRGFDLVNHGLTIYYNTSMRHPELSEMDRSQPNPIARPDIYVSRINARHIALNPDPYRVDINGDKFLDSQGKPQSVQFNSTISLDHFVFWSRDEALERRILIDYFDRNHAFRTGSYSELPFRSAAIGYELSAAALHSVISDALPFESITTMEDATLMQYVDWLKTPAVLRAIAPHSHPYNSKFCFDDCEDSYSSFDLENAVGDKPWRWWHSASGDTERYKPSLASQTGEADFYIYRTLWENKMLVGSGANLFVHNGCEANSPAYSATLPYNDNNYGFFQNMEGLMFYANGLAVLSRAKIFNDNPHGFSNGFKNNAHAPFGAGWMAYFERDASLSNQSTLVAACKKTYTWSVLGDWSIQIAY